MKTYNTKVFTFANGTKQVRLYDKCIHNNEKNDSKKDFLRVEKENYIKPIQPSFEDFNNPFIDLEKEYSEFKERRSRENSYNRTKQKIYELARSNSWEYFITFTLDPKKIDRTDYDKISKTIKKWIDRIRENYAPDLKYLLVPELHKDMKSYHFHALFSAVGNLEFVDSGIKDNNGRIIYNLKNYRYGFSTATKVSDTNSVSHYLTKYITKELTSVTTGKKRYWSSRNLEKPIVDTYLLTTDEKERFICDNEDSILHYKTLDVPIINQKISYIEMEKN